MVVEEETKGKVGKGKQEGKTGRGKERDVSEEEGREGKEGGEGEGEGGGERERERGRGSLAGLVSFQYAIPLMLSLLCYPSWRSSLMLSLLAELSYQVLL